MKKMINGVLMDMTQVEIDSLPLPPTPEEIAAEARAKERAEAEAELQATDWVVVRAMEQYLTQQSATSDIPADVLAARIAARTKASR